MVFDLYYAAPSAPCRAVSLLARALGISPNIKNVNLMEKEQFADEFLEMNPQHTIPLIVDNDFPLSESRAILIYLVEKYGEDDSLYPKDGNQRAIINQRLFFDLGTLFSRVTQCFFVPVIWQKQGVNEDMMDKVEEAFSILDTYLEGHDWVSGDQITIADYSIVSTVSTVEGIGFDLSQHPNVLNWLQRCKEQMDGYEELNQSGVDMFVDIYKTKLSQLEE